MSWSLLALLGAALWGASNVVDASLVRKAATPGALLAVTGLAGGLPGLVFACYSQGGIDWTLATSGAFVGILGLACSYPYFRALEHGEAASVVLLWNLSPVLVAILAHLLLHESLSSTDALAIAAFVGSAVVGGWTLSAHHSSRLRAGMWMLVASSLTALEAVSQKALLNQMSFPTVMALTATGGVTFSAILMLLSKDLRRNVACLCRQLHVVLLGETFNQTAMITTVLAASLAPVSLVKAVGSTQPLFVVLFTGKRRLRTSPRTRWSRFRHLASHSLGFALAAAGFILLGGP